MSSNANAGGPEDRPDLGKSGAQTAVAAQATAPRSESRIIVKFKDGIDSNQIMQSANDVSTLQAGGAKITKIFSNLAVGLEGKIVVVEANAKNSVDALLETYRSRADVEFAEPDYIYQPLLVPNDNDFDDLWGLHNTGQNVNGTSGSNDADIDAVEAWDLVSTGSETVVMVIDTGVDYTHEDLADAMWVNPGEGTVENGIDDDSNGYVDDIFGIDPFDNDDDPLDGGAHGTHVAGTIAATMNNSVGVAGVASAASNVKIMGCRFLGPDGGSSSDAIECLDYAVMMKNSYGINVVATNNSWGGGGFSTSLSNAIQSSIQAGIAFIAAAGNAASNNDSSPSYPASYSYSNPNIDGVISVASTDQNDGLSSFSNFGATSVDVGAPGSNIRSTIYGGGNYVPQGGDIYFEDFSGSSPPPPPPGTLSLSAPVPGVAEAVNTFAVSGATPGASISIYRGKREGSDIVDGCDTGLRRPKLIVSGTADGSGNLSPSTYVNSNKAEKTGAIQAVDTNTCEVSNVVTPVYSASGSALSSQDVQPLVVTGGWTGTGSWATTSTGSCEGWDDSPSGNYNNNTSSTVTSSTINLSGLAGQSVRLGFVLDHELESSYDFLLAEISNDGGTNWSTVGEITGFANNRLYVFAIAERYRTSNFRIRFRMSTDGSVTEDGVCIEEVGIGFGSGSDDYSNFFGTSMATPHVAGIYALLSSEVPSASVTQIKSAILDTVDTVPGLSGQVLTNGRVNLNAALIELGGGGPPPPPPPGTLSLSAPIPGVADAVNTFPVSGATPGASISVYRGRKEGSDIVDGCSVDLKTAKLIVSGTANGSGELNPSTFFSAAKASRTGAIQAVDTNTCEVSNVVIPSF